MITKLSSHYRSFKQAWGVIIKQPAEHLLNIGVLALIISLCGAGILIKRNLTTWQQQHIVYPQLVIYLANSASAADINRLEQALNKQPSVHHYQFISKQQGLAELQQEQPEIATTTANNPLPDILVVTSTTAESAKLQNLKLKLQQLAMVSAVQVDLAYAGKISDLINFANSLCFFIQGLFILVLCLVVYNLVRLQMLLNRAAIVVSRLIGASNSFIMQPLMHYAVLQVTLASLLALLALQIATNFSNKLLANFNNLFSHGIQVTPLPLSDFLGMWLILVSFTLLSVFLAVRWVFYNTSQP